MILEWTMKRTIKTILVICIAAVMLISLAACAQSDVPDGYQLVACEGDEFRLYVPTQWVVNTTSGTTSAYYTSDAEMGVTVTLADDAKGLTLEEYWGVCDAKYRTDLQEYSYDGNVKRIVMGGKAAEARFFTAKLTRFNDTLNESVTKDYKLLQVNVQNNGDTYVFIYSAPIDQFDSQLEVVEGNSNGEGIIPYFKFAEPYTSEDNAKDYDESVEAPEGMKIASGEDRPYRFFIPESWQINTRTDATAAYVSESDSSNVNVGMYMTSLATETVADHYKRLEESYKTSFSAYTLISDEEITMDGISAHKYTYTVVSGGQEYKIVQAIVRKGEMFYYVTYTATPERFEKHLGDVDKMIANFDIR